MRQCKISQNLTLVVKIIGPPDIIHQLAEFGLYEGVSVCQLDENLFKIGGKVVIIRADVEIVLDKELII